MNNLPDDRAKLLAESLHGDWTTGPAAAMACRAAAHARRRRAVRQAGLAVAVAASVAGVILVSRPPAPRVSTVPIAAAKPAYEIISDEELLAVLKDRPLLVLPQENGPQKIVLLDR